MNIKQLVKRYLAYWENADIGGLMSMYDKNMSYHDMPSDDVIEYSKLEQFLSNTFAKEKNQRFELKDSVFVVGNSAFIYWSQSFTSVQTSKKVSVNGVELIVFKNNKIVNVHDFYDYHASTLKKSPSILENINKYGLNDEMIRQVATEINQYFDDKESILNPDLNLTTLSDKLGYTRNQVSFVINHLLGRTFYDMLNERRVEYVMYQMTINEPKKAILELAVNSGFNSVSGFYNAFKKYTGLTPAQYQRSKTS
jgi:AraC-like DNA-binding protein